MRNHINRIFVGILIGSLYVSIGSAQDYQKLGQTGFKFLSVISDARGAAMANAMTSLQVGSSALFFNPAGMSGMESFVDISASNNKWIADINHYTVGIAINPAKGDYGVIGLSLQYVDYGNIIETRVSGDPTNLKGYDDVGLFKLNALALGVGYAKSISDQFSVGGQIRWARQDLGSSFIPNEVAHIQVLDSAGLPTGAYVDSTRNASNRLTPLVFDFGTQFKTGIKSLVFGMSIRNFSQEIQYVYEQFQLPLVFTLGISMNLLDLVGEVPMDQSLLMSIDASHYRDHPEQLKLGMEYSLLKTLSLRGGYATNSDESGMSFGVGFSKFGFVVDYAYTPFGVFGKVQRFTVRFSY
jgi:hypothetical protein